MQKLTRYTPLKRYTAANKRSAKQAKRNQRYRRIKEIYRETISDLDCQRCGHPAECIHHGVGRIGELLFDKTFFILLCSGCHTWVEEHPKEAKALYLSFSRFDPVLKAYVYKK